MPNVCAWLIALVIVLTAPCYAATFDVQVDPAFVHRQWTVDDGLPVNTLSSVAVDAEGLIWIGSAEGLVRFDGHSFVRFGPQQISSLGSPRINDLVRVGSGLLVLSGAHTLTYYRSGRFSAVSGLQSADGAARRLVRQKGKLWLITDHALYLVQDDGSVQRVRGVPDDHYLTHFNWDEKRLWMTTVGGVAWREGDDAGWHPSASRVMNALPVGKRMVFLRQDESPLLFDNGDWQSGVDANDPLAELHGSGSVAELPWGTRLLINGKRYFQIDGHRLHDSGRTTGAYSLRSSVAALVDGHRWLVLGSRLLRDGEPVFELADDSTLYSLSVAPNGIVWMASNRRGLHALVPRKVEVVGTQQGLPSDNVYAVYEDPEGAVWIGTHGMGGVRIGADGQVTTSFPSRLDQPSFPRTFLADHDGRMWVGMREGIRLFVDGRLDPPTADQGSWPERSVNALVERRPGDLWVATEAGLYRRQSAPDGGAFWQRHGSRSLPDQHIRALAVDPGGAVWVASANGLARWDGAQNWRIISVKGEPLRRPRTLTIDDESMLWIGTEGDGIARLDTRAIAPTGALQIDRISRADGLHSDGAHAIAVDGPEHLWISSNQGIYLLNRQQIDQFFANKRQSVESIALGEIDGLRNNEGNGGSGNASARSRDGRIWFATQGGVAVIDPPRLFAPPAASAHLRINHLSTSGKSVDLHMLAQPNAIELEAAERTITIDYSWVSVREAQRAKYQYRLRGYDDSWTQAGHRRQAHFTHVPPGNYVFEVRVTGLLAPPAVTSAALSLQIAAHWYEQIWFRWLVFGLALLSIWALYRLRSATLNARHQEQRADLERIVAERTAVISEQSARLRQLSVKKTELFTNLSHDFRSPLTMAIAPLQNLLDGRRGPIAPAVKADLTAALHSSQQMLTLIEQILEIAKMASTEEPLRLVSTPLAGFLSERLSSFQSLSESKQIRSRVDCADGTLSAAIDAAQLSRAVDNLLANAFRFTPIDGEVTLKLALLDRRWIQISVTDSGPGIEANRLERIFVRFESGDGDKHTGIGLAQCRQIVELHGGRIRVFSTPGQGSRFVLSLPWTDEAESDGVASHSASPVSTDPAPSPTLGADCANALPPDNSSGIEHADYASDQDREREDALDRPQVLVVDDSDQIREVIAQTLSPHYRVLQAENAASALGLASRMHPDLVLCDLIMPDMDGFALVRAIRADAALRSIPVVLLTAMDSSEYKLQGLQLGIDDYLTKPFDASQLRARIDNLIEGRRRIAANDQPQLSVREPQARAALSADQRFIDRVLEIIDEKISDSTFGVETLAQAMACDRSYLFRKSRELLQESPSALIRGRRLAQADSLLRCRAGSVSSIAYQVGFKSLSHFSQCFKERYGCSPSVRLESNDRA